MNVIGAVTSKRSSRADSVAHTNISAATIARSEALICSPAEIEHAYRVVLEYLRPHLRLDVELAEVGQPPVRRDQRIVRTEHHLVLQQRVGVPDELRREIL